MMMGLRNAPDLSLIVLPDDVPLDEFSPDTAKFNFVIQTSSEDIDVELDADSDGED